MQYDVAAAKSLEELIKLVNEKIKQGWKLQGGIGIGAFEFSSWYYQAIVKD